MLRKKFGPPAEIEPVTLQVPVGRPSYWAMGISPGEQVAGFGVATILHISRVRWTKAKQHTDSLASYASTLRKCCVHFEANQPLKCDEIKNRN